MNILSLIVGTFIGALGAFLTNRSLDLVRKYDEKIVSANLALITLKNQYNEFLLFRRSFYGDVEFVSKDRQVPIHTLAKQMGTSVLMIERHYSHLQVIQAIEQLRGANTRKLIEADSKAAENYPSKNQAKKREALLA